LACPQEGPFDSGERRCRRTMAAPHRSGCSMLLRPAVAPASLARTCRGLHLRGVARGHPEEAPGWSETTPLERAAPSSLVGVRRVGIGAARVGIGVGIAARDGAGGGTTSTAFAGFAASVEPVGTPAPASDVLSACHVGGPSGATGLKWTKTLPLSVAKRDPQQDYPKNQLISLATLDVLEQIRPTWFEASGWFRAGGWPRSTEDR
jgi:hypothetical protein